MDVNVLAFGASTGATDNTAAIQMAIDVAALLNKHAYVPPGVFKTTGALKLKADNSGLAGEGVISYGGTGYALNFGKEDSVAGSNYRNLLLQGVTIIGTPSAAGAVRSFAATRSVIDRIKIKGFANGYGVNYHQYGWINTLSNCDIQTCKVAVQISVGTQDSASQSGNALTITGGELGAGCDYGLLIGDPAQTAQTVPCIGMGITLHGVTIEGAKQWGIWAIDGWNINVHACYFEKNGSLTTGCGHIRLGNGTVKPSGVSIRDSIFLGSVGTDGYGILVSNGEWANINHNHFRHGGLRATGIKYLLGDFARVQENFISASVTTPYDFPATGNFILQKTGPSMGESNWSGSHGWDWRAQSSYLHRFISLYGDVVGEIDRVGKATFDGGLVLKAPDGTRWLVKVANDGTLSTVAA